MTWNWKWKKIKKSREQREKLVTWTKKMAAIMKKYDISIVTHYATKNRILSKWEAIVSLIDCKKSSPVYFPCPNVTRNSCAMNQSAIHRYKNEPLYYATHFPYCSTRENSRFTINRAVNQSFTISGVVESIQRSIQSFLINPVQLPNRKMWT